MKDNEFSTAVKQCLTDCISALDSSKSQYLKNPGSDFTRNRKIGFKDVIRFCIQAEGGTLQNELLKQYDFEPDTPTKSALCQQRSKISPDAFKSLFRDFTDRLISLDAPKAYKGYRLIACDGSDINIPYNRSDSETYHQNGCRKGYNQLHLNATYDILNGIYVDCVLEPDRKSHERAALITMIDRYSTPAPSIFIADRGYEGYSVFGHLISSGQKFMIRLKSPDSNGILSPYEFQHDSRGEFDCDVSTILTWKQTNDVKSDYARYTYVSRNAFDCYDEDDPFYPLSLRILCIEVSQGKYDYIATNLSRDEFSLQEIGKLYHLRWDEETSFRDLKYIIGLVHFHCYKRDYVEQEVWAKLILYNLCEAITRHIVVTRQDSRGKARKYSYKVNFEAAACICRKFLRAFDEAMDICHLIGRFLSPVRPNRSAPRNLRAQSAKSFLYRAA